MEIKKEVYLVITYRYDEEHDAQDPTIRGVFENDQDAESRANSLRLAGYDETLIHAIELNNPSARISL